MSYIFLHSANSDATHVNICNSGIIRGRGRFADLGKITIIGYNLGDLVDISIMEMSRMLWRS